jgi:hypothetical protein
VISPLFICPSVSSNNFWTMKFSMEVMPLKVTSTPYFYSHTSTIQKWRAFNILTWMQNLNQLTWDNAILCAGRSTKDEQLLIRYFCERPKIWTCRAVESCCFVKITRDPSELYEVRYSKTSWSYQQVFVESSFCLTKLLNMAIVWFLGYIWTKSGPLCVEFCNFVHWHISVNYLTSVQ